MEINSEVVIAGCTEGKKSDQNHVLGALSVPFTRHCVLKSLCTISHPWTKSREHIYEPTVHRSHHNTANISSYMENIGNKAQGYSCNDDTPAEGAKRQHLKPFLFYFGKAACNIQHTAENQVEYCSSQMSSPRIKEKGLMTCFDLGCHFLWHNVSTWQRLSAGKKKTLVYSVHVHKVKCGCACARAFPSMCVR